MDYIEYLRIDMELEPEMAWVAREMCSADASECRNAREQERHRVLPRPRERLLHRGAPADAALPEGLGARAALRPGAAHEARGERAGLPPGRGAVQPAVSEPAGAVPRLRGDAVHAQVRAVRDVLLRRVLPQLARELRGPAEVPHHARHGVRLLLLLVREEEAAGVQRE